jgi:formate dehydrogenase major subunit
MVTERVRPIKLADGTVVHQIGMPYHWSYSGISTGDTANDLLGIVLDPNTHIQEDKVSTADIRPGRRPRGTELVDFVEEYRKRAGVQSGRVGVNGRAPVESSTGMEQAGS